MIIIKNRFSEKIIFKSSKKNIKEALEFRVKRGANLDGASLIDASLESANPRGASLEDAYLKVKTPPINSHNFISEVLLIEAKTEAQIDFSCRVGKQTNQCWKYFIKLAEQKQVLKWALEVLFQWEEFKEKYRTTVGS